MAQQQPFMAFENEADIIIIDGLTAENRLDRISIYGSIEITKDEEGRKKALMLKRIVDAAVDALKREGYLLPEHIETIKEETVKNPF